MERALCDSIDIGDIDDDEPGRAKRSISKALKRHVLHRDGYRCRVPGCSATANVDCHHIVFVCNGGPNEAPNLIALCEGHHLALHAGTLIIEGDATNARFTFRAQSKFEMARRAVECAAELRKRGVAKGLVKAAVDATRTHVGSQNLTLEQWVDVALRKVAALS
ncbi:MAG TPA: HNH endonuclease signature motif containing protein [Kofleriaceae bacterium]|nr:HNH endonuclease signature motif containing protein [Kofleriaceae bacterium]